MKRIFAIVIGCVSLLSVVFGVMSFSITAIFASVIFAIFQGLLISMSFSKENSPVVTEIVNHFVIAINLTIVPWLYTFFPMTRANLVFADIGLGIMAFSILLDMVLLFFTERKQEGPKTKIPFLIIGLVFVPLVIGHMVYQAMDLTHVTEKTQWFSVAIDILILVMAPLTYALVLLKDKRFSLFSAHLTFFLVQVSCYIGLMLTDINNVFHLAFSFNSFIVCYPFFVASIVCLTFFQRTKTIHRNQEMKLDS